MVEKREEVGGVIWVVTESVRVRKGRAKCN